jgi:phosphomannomutase
MPKTLLESLNYHPVELAFGTSGLRGLATDMTDLECYINTLGFVEFLLETDDVKPGSLVALAGDFRESTPRILLAVSQAIQDAGCKVVYLGKIPTPAAAYYGLQTRMPVAMVTGSHIPKDRNGIKFYKLEGEVLKEDEAAIKAAVARVRNKIMSQEVEDSAFDADGSLKHPSQLPDIQKDAADNFIKRYSSLFDKNIFKGKTIVVYQHSSLAADMLVELLQALGAEVIPVDKSSIFIPIDTENVTAENQHYFESLASKYPQNFAIISADGDADRPFVVDEAGTFHRGDVLGAIVADFLSAKFAAVPISANDAIDTFLNQRNIQLIHTKVGSPYVISAMNEAKNKGIFPAVGWEVNGGFLTGSDIKLNGAELTALATRDAFLPIVCALAAAVQKNCKLSELFAVLPERFTQAGLLDNFPIPVSKKILAKYSEDTPQKRQELQNYFKSEDGFGEISSINGLDGMRISFSGGDIAHVRPSGNAPQLRIYSVANSQKRADDIVALAIAEPSGILRNLEKAIEA